jgi:hypothetical protein
VLSAVPVTTVSADSAEKRPRFIWIIFYKCCRNNTSYPPLIQAHQLITAKLPSNKISIRGSELRCLNVLFWILRVLRKLLCRTLHVELNFMRSV